MPDRPNILMIVCHDLGRHLACYGAAGVPSLTLDWIAEQGVRFANYFAGSTPCSPSRGCIVTGQHAHTNGLIGLTHRGFALNPGQRTFIHDLADAGYATHLFGFQHEVDWAHPDLLGYQRTWTESSAADQVAAKVCAFLRSPEAKGGPFFAMAGFSEVHLPFTNPKYVPDRPEDVWVPPWLPDTIHTRRELARFNGCIRFMDQAVGQILWALDATPQAANTLLVFTTDHGMAFPRAKSTLYDAGIGTALLMRWPARVKAGAVREELLSNIDLGPTLLAAAGVPTPARMQGRSFLPLLTGEGAYEPRDAVFAERNFHDHYDPVRAVRTERWKYIRSFERRPMLLLSTDVRQSEPGRTVSPVTRVERPHEELYDLQADRAELVNLARAAAPAEVQAGLAARLDRWMHETQDPLLAGPIPPPPGSRQDALPEIR